MVDFATERGESGQRFDIRHRLGSGGMGVVYEVFDRWRNEIVALKKLMHPDAAAIYRLKQEFRSLADIAHPNLVSLHELVNQGEDWFFTMELVRGTTFIAYVRPTGGSWSGENDKTVTESTGEPHTQRQHVPDSESSDSVTVISTPTGITNPPLALPPLPPSAIESTLLTPTPITPAPIAYRDFVPDEDTLRAALRQLVEGVAALHGAGKLHRDLKPSNVLVTPQGRVVILDFGLASDVQPGRKLTFAGTPAYMSPEQLGDQPATEASDWYAVGLMLYEALTGDLPFGGDSAYSMFVQKQSADAVAPSSFVRGVPHDLDRLCIDLLRRAPESRPLGAEILRRLKTQSIERSMPAKLAIRAKEVPFVGRDRELEQLHAAMHEVREGNPIAVLIHGRSGMGKSTLVRRFIEEARGVDRSVVVLTGRCYEQESVPFKALDSLIDDLMQYLRSLTPLEAKAVMPTNIAALTRLFPVLEGVEAMRKGRRKADDVVDSQQLRRRAFAALREMMARIVDERPVVLFLDDLQWGDRDSAAAIAEILRPPDAPPLLLVATYRREEAENSPFLRELRKQREDGTIADVREIAIDELQASAAHDLARALLGSGAREDRVEAVAREAAGSPFFIQEIGRFFTGDGDAVVPGGEDGASSVDDWIRARVGRLSNPEQDLLDVVAVAGQPLEASIARTAAQIASEELPAVLSTLRAAHLARTRVRGGREEIVAYHDRIREALVHQMEAPRKKALHLRLATTLEELGWPDPEVLAVHFQGAGDSERAAVHALQAADKAAASLAFDHAARLYRLALDLQGFENAAPSRLIQLAEALGNAGRAEAAEHYLRVSDMLEGRDALEMRRRAAEYLLRSGHIDEGLRTFESVLEAIGIKLPATRRRALLGIIFRKLLQRFRGLEFTERDASEVPADELLMIDVLWGVIVGLSRTDTLLAVYFQTMHLRLALQAGELYRVSRAVAIEAGFTAMGGGPAKKKSDALLQRNSHYARKVNVPHAMGLALLTQSIASFLQGRFQDTVTQAQQADEIFRTRCTGVWWELITAQNYVLTGLAYLGQMETLSQRVSAQLREAEERGDLYAVTDMVGRVGIVWLTGDQPDGARRALRSAMSQWSPRSFYLQHLYTLSTEALIDLYNDEPEAAWQRVDDRWAALTASPVMRIQVLRTESLCLHGRVALAAARARGGDKALVDLAERHAKRITNEKKMHWSKPLAIALLAGAAALRGDQPRARTLFDEAITGFEKAEMMLHAACARRRLGQLTPGPEGEALVTAADAWMTAQRVKKPGKIANVLTPF